MNKKKLIGIGAAVVAVVAVVLLAVFVIIPMFGGKQVTKVKDALFETLESKSMTVKVTMDGEDEIKLKVEYSEDDEELYIQYAAEESDYTYYYIMDSDALYYAMYDKEEEEAVARRISEVKDNTLLSALFSGEDKLYEALEDMDIKDFVGEDIEFDLDDPKALVEEMIDAFEEKDNLEECLDAETKREDGETIYVFKPDVYKTITLAMKTVKSRFEDKDLYDDLREEVKHDEEYYDELDLKISVSVDKSVLTGIDIKIDDDGDEGRVKLKFSDVGSTSVSLPSEVKDALKDVKEEYKDSQEDKDSEGEAEDVPGGAVAVPMG